MTDRRLLIVEDDVGLQKQMRWCFSDISTQVAASLKDAEELLHSHRPQVVTLDLGLPPDAGGTTQGFKCLEAVRSLLPSTKVIVVTGREDRESAIEAIARGAYDFYQKPIDAQTLQFAVNRAFTLWELEDENRELLQNGRDDPLEGLITANESMLAICRQVERVAPTNATVAILGDTGTGKEVIARNIHRLSNRSGPFVAINCAAIPESLLESELFGYEKGAFTGASGRKSGRIEDADGGTLFLDEIGDMPLPLQAKILRFLQERSFERIGGNRPIEADVRVVSATHNNLEEMIAQGTFREDLFYRLTEISLTLPPLSERGQDAVLLATYFLRKNNSAGAKLSGAAQNAISAYPWPGNIRELENKIKRAVILCDGNSIEPEDLELAPQAGRDDLPLDLKTVRAAAEREAIHRAMIRSDGNVSHAARLLGVSRPTLYNLFEKYQIQPDTGR